MIIILDSNILRSDPYFKKTPMQILIKLCNNNEIKLNLPNIVINEFITQQEKEFKDLLDPLKQKLLNKKTKAIDNDEITLINNSIREMEQCETHAMDSIKKRINNFISQTNAVILKNTDIDIDELLKMYFLGLRPFKSIKSREDIPDAIIYLQIKKILKKGPIVFVTEDNYLRESMKNIDTYRILSDFVNSKNVRQKLHKIQRKELRIFIEENIEYHKNDIKFILERTIEKELEYKEFKDEYIHDDNNDATIDGIPTILSTDISFDTFYSYDEDIYTIQFSAEIEANINYFIFKADLYVLDQDRIDKIFIEDWNKHYYSAQEEHILNVEGIAGLKFNLENKNINDEELIFDDIDIVINDLEINIMHGDDY